PGGIIGHAGAADNYRQATLTIPDLLPDHCALRSCPSQKETRDGTAQDEEAPRHKLRSDRAAVWGGVLRVGPADGRGAESAGAAMEIRILKIVPNPFGINFNLPGKDFPTIGALALEMPDGFVKFFTLDLAKRQAEFKPGIILDLRPFPGTLAVGIDPNDPAPRKGGTTDSMAPVSTLRPWKNGSNMDINELQEGTTIFIPVFLKGGLVWTGDSHCRQGNGEVNLTALECSYREIAMQLIARKDMKLEWPRMETKTHWIMMGFDEDLNKALVNAVRETVNFLEAQQMIPLNRYEAYSLASMAADCRV